jgi:hypothetical protein
MKKNSKIDLRKYPTTLGKLTINLHSLEVKIRLFLLICDIGNEEATKYAQNLRTLKIHQEVDTNPFTNYDTLKELIEKYNKQILSYSFNGLTISKDLWKLRNALAHGRAFKIEPSTKDTPLTLLKFSGTDKNKTKCKTKVDFLEVMTQAWLDEKTNWVLQEYNKVIEACRKTETIKP